jgi:homogentisate 1,2-dioxygenase
MVVVNGRKLGTELSGREAFNTTVMPITNQGGIDLLLLDYGLMRVCERGFAVMPRSVTHEESFHASIQ